MSISLDLSTYRMADANTNRCIEGLRILEDVARFVLDNSGLSSELKDLRHAIAGAVDKGMDGYLPLLNARNAQDDVGYAPSEDAERRSGLVELVVANAKRSQQSLRVIEELSRLPSLEKLDTAFFQSARYKCYQIEQRLVSLVTRRQKIARLPGLYAIIDPEVLNSLSIVEAARQAVRGGASVIQLRDKKRDKGLVLRDAMEIQQMCSALGGIFIMNDHPDIAAVCGADGVHLGQSDMTVEAARKVLPFDAIIGVSTATVAEALKAVDDGADYVAVGSIFPTGSKSNTRPAGLDTLRKVRGAVSLPIVAIGGIDADNLAEVVDGGADGIAVISALLKQNDIQEAANILTKRFRDNYDRPL